MYLFIYLFIGVAIILLRSVDYSSVWGNLRIGPTYWLYFCDPCTACDCSYFKSL